MTAHPKVSRASRDPAKSLRDNPALLVRILGILQREEGSTGIPRSAIWGLCMDKLALSEDRAKSVCTAMHKADKSGSDPVRGLLVKYRDASIRGGEATYKLTPKALALIEASAPKTGV